MKTTLNIAKIFVKRSTLNPKPKLLAKQPINKAEPFQLKTSGKFEEITQNKNSWLEDFIIASQLDHKEFLNHIEKTQIKFELNTEKPTNITDSVTGKEKQAQTKAVPNPKTDKTLESLPLFENPTNKGDKVQTDPNSTGFSPAKPDTSSEKASGTGGDSKNIETEKPTEPPTPNNGQTNQGDQSNSDNKNKWKRKFEQTYKEAFEGYEKVDKDETLKMRGYFQKIWAWKKVWIPGTAIIFCIYGWEETKYRSKKAIENLNPLELLKDSGRNDKLKILEKTIEINREEIQKLLIQALANEKESKENNSLIKDLEEANTKLLEINTMQKLFIKQECKEKNELKIRNTQLQEENQELRQESVYQKLWKQISLPSPIVTNPSNLSQKSSHSK